MVGFMIKLAVLQTAKKNAPAHGDQRVEGTERVSLSLRSAGDERGAELFESFCFFDEADAAVFEGDHQLARKAFRNHMQFLKSVAQFLFPDGIFRLDVRYYLPADLSVFVGHDASLRY